MTELFGSVADRTHITHFCAVFNCILQPTVSSYEVLSGVVVDHNGADVQVKIDVSMSNDS